MPHCVILYTPNLDGQTDITTLCRLLADTMLQVQDESGAPVFPKGGTRVLAYPAAHSAISDGGQAGRNAGGSGEYSFVYLNVRMAQGRSPVTHRAVGDAMVSAAKQHFAQILANQHIGITIQVDEGNEVFDAKISTLHPLFQR